MGFTTSAACGIALAPNPSVPIRHEGLPVGAQGQRVKTNTQCVRLCASQGWRPMRSELQTIATQSRLHMRKWSRRAPPGVAFATAKNLDKSEGPVVVESIPAAEPPVESSRVRTPGLTWGAFWRFCRPHTIYGTILSICSVSSLAFLNTTDLNLRAAIGVLQALVPAVLANIYIVGLNQIYDVEIDKLNKPDLPLASGEFTMKTASTIVLTCAALSLAMGVAVGSAPLLLTLIVSIILGTAYSIDLPFLRWKKYPVLAAGCILSVRALIVQLGFFSHMQTYVFGRAAALNRPVAFGTAFMCLFAVVIALCKDIPDYEGDRLYGIRSFTVRLGQKRVFWLCVSILIAAYAGAVVFGLASQQLWSRATTAVSHTAAVCLLWRAAQQVDLKSKAAIATFYMFVWKLFYFEYLLLPFVR